MQESNQNPCCGWISVDDKLPAPETHVLVWIGWDARVAFRIGGEDWTSDWIDVSLCGSSEVRDDLKGVTFWQPIVAPAK